MNTANARQFILLLLTGLYCMYSYAQTASQNCRAYFNDVEQLRQLNGNILLADHGRIVYERSCGYADFSWKQVNHPDARYNIASISKVFTATAILQLKEKGKLSLDHPLTTWLPDFPYAEVRIKHLLTHTSGMADFELFESLVKKYPDTVITNNNIIPALKEQQRGLYFKPGDKYSYCNAGYSLLALLVEKVSGSTFPDYLEKNIFKPAGMQATYVYTPQAGNRPPMAWAGKYLNSQVMANRLDTVDLSLAWLPFIAGTCGVSKPS